MAISRQDIFPDNREIFLTHLFAARFYAEFSLEKRIHLVELLREQDFAAAKDFLQQLPRKAVKKAENELAQAKNMQLVSIVDELYPKRLLNIEDPPLLLFVLGDLEVFSLLDSGLSVSVVGARKATSYGIRNAKSLAQQVVERGGFIVSGLARGIDAAAHMGSLAGVRAVGGSAGIAVLGSGLHRMYPEQNRGLAEEIVKSRGLVITEYGPTFPPTKFSFPERNRIVSGLCDKLVVVEADLRSGSLITARLAVEQGRDVFALPGSVDSVMSRGCHHLIEQGAAILTSVKDLLGDVAEVPVTSTKRKVSTKSLDELSEPGLAKEIFEQLSVDEALSIEDIAELSGQDFNRVKTSVFELEAIGLVESKPGGRFSLSER